MRGHISSVTSVAVVRLDLDNRTPHDSWLTAAAKLVLCDNYIDKESGT